MRWPPGARGCTAHCRRRPEKKASRYRSLRRRQRSSSLVCTDTTSPSTTGTRSGTLRTSTQRAASVSPTKRRQSEPRKTPRAYRTTGATSTASATLTGSYSPPVRGDPLPATRRGDPRTSGVSPVTLTPKTSSCSATWTSPAPTPGVGERGGGGGGGVMEELLVARSAGKAPGKRHLSVSLTQVYQQWLGNQV